MIEVKNISFSYGKNDILKDVSFTMNPGEVVGILGNNGAGKSTFITCLNRVNTPKTGQLVIDGNDMLKAGRQVSARNISYVAQKSSVGHATVFDTVLLGRKPYIKWSMSKGDIDICNETIHQIGMDEFCLRYVNELSGGELQKVMLARALVQEPKLLLLDEPTSNLDPKNQYEMMSLVRDVARERQIGVMVVIHDLSLALRFCDKFLFLKDGVVHRYGDESIITPETIKDVYGIDAKIVPVDGRKIVMIQ